MKWFRDRGGELSAIEATLRDREAPAGCRASSATSPHGSSDDRARRGGRPAFALLLTAGTAAAFLSFGGVGYAVDAVQTVVSGGGAQTASDDEYGGPCVEYVNPHGKTIPPAGLTPPGTNPKGGENPDGFYQVGNYRRRRRDRHRSRLRGPSSARSPVARRSSTRRLRARRRARRRSAATTGRPVRSRSTSRGPATSRSCPSAAAPTQTCLVPPPPK